MTDLRKAAEMALEALESFRLAQNPLVPQSIYVLRKALAQPEQCICHRCIKENDLREGAFPLSSTIMILCPECGNKRCPKASDHRLSCTESNESGQEGSVYTAQPEQKPYCWVQSKLSQGMFYKEKPRRIHTIPLFTAPPSKPWVSLTEKEIAEAVGSPIDEVYLNDFRKVEAALRSKNDPAAN